MCTTGAWLECEGWLGRNGMSRANISANANMVIRFLPERRRRLSVKASRPGESGKNHRRLTIHPATVAHRTRLRSAQADAGPRLLVALRVVLRDV